MSIHCRKILFVIFSIIFIFNMIFIFTWIMPPENNNIFSVANNDNHRLCVIFPYRDRFEELQRTLPGLYDFLKRQNLNFNFIVVNQTDSIRFNRAVLVNIGSLEANHRGCDYIAIHDVDIVPLNKNLNYSYPGKGQLMHITSGRYHPIKRYDYKNYIGGVLIMTLNDFFKVNGMSNNYWGWGLEDDNFYARLKHGGLAGNITRPMDLKTNRTNTFLHIHTRKRDYRINEYRAKRLQGLDQTSGLSTLNYKLRGKYTRRMEQVEYIVLNVKLHCNQTSCTN